jgi:hypothetical protein
MIKKNDIKRSSQGYAQQQPDGGRDPRTQAMQDGRMPLGQKNLQGRGRSQCRTVECPCGRRIYKVRVAVNAGRSNAPAAEEFTR